MRSTIRTRLPTFALLAAVALLPVAAGAGEDAPAIPDPVPLRRVLVPASRVAAELERARQGVLVKLPRAEFEARVARAARSSTQPGPARLVRAAYTARLEGSALVGGGDWTVVNPGQGPAVLPLPDLNLALRKITLDDPAANAVLGELDGKTLGLLVARTGKQSVFFDWSLRGGQAGAELHFDLQVPACPVASLELTLPTDRSVVVSRGVALVSGPHEAADTRQRVWRLQFAGRARVDLVVRGPDGAGRVPPLLLAQLTATQQLTPQHLFGRYEFQIEALHGGARELVFDYEPLLEPYDVTADRAELQGWELDRARHLLTVRLREPFQGTLQPLRLAILCQAPLFKDKSDRRWSSPGVRLRGAAVQGETLVLQASSDVRLEGFDAGAFRLVKTASAADGGQVLTLVDAAAGAPRPPRPSATVQSHGADVQARQLTWWQLGPERTALTVEVHYEVTRGRLFKLPLRATADWEVAEVRLEPKGLLGAWPQAVSKGGLLVVELQQALAVGTRAKLTVRLRPRLERGVPAAGLTLPFPDLEPLDVRLREGLLAIGVDPFYQAAIVQVSHAAARPDSDGPWGEATPNYAYPFRGKGVTGLLRLFPHGARVHARCSTDVYFAAGRATLLARLQIEPAAGSPAWVDVLLSAATSGPVKWRCEGQPNLLREAQRLPAVEAAPRLLALGARGPLEAAALLAAVPGGECWRVTFARPLAQRTTLILEARLPDSGAPPAEQGWDVPLLAVRGAERMEGEVALHLLGTELLHVEASALRESGRDAAPPVGPPRGDGPMRPDSWRLFRYGPALFPGRLPALRITGRTAGDVRSPQEVCDRSRLTTYVEPRGRLLHHFRFRVWNWRQRELPVLLPAGVKLLAAKAEGRWLDCVGQQETPSGVKVELPVPAGAEPHRFELVYAADGDWPAWAPWRRLHAPAPKLPVPPASFYRTWRLPPGVVPLTQALRRLPDALGPHDPEPWWGSLRSAWVGSRSWLAAVAPELGPRDWATAQKEALAAAEDALRQGAAQGRPWRFGNALERLALAHPQQQLPLVVDAVALRAEGVRSEAGFTPSTHTAPGTGCLFAGLGLTYLPCPPAPLLTTRRQVELWQAAAGELPTGAGALAQAVAEALAHGRDSSGRFQTVAYWLARRGGGEEAPPPLDPAAGPPLPGADSFGATWTEWEDVAGVRPEGELLAVRQGGVRAFGLTLAGLFCLLAWRVRRSLPRRWRFRLVMLWLAASGLALFWLPPALADAAWWPALAGCAAALVGYLRLGAPVAPAHPDRSRGGKTEKLLKAGAASAALALLLAAPSAALQLGGEPFTVLLLPADPPAGGDVLVAPELLGKLDNLVRRGQAPIRNPVLLGGEYTGQVVQDRAEFTVDFQVYCPAEEGTLTVPLTGVELKPGSLWAGARVYPVAAAGQGGYTIHLKRSGPHPVNTLRLSFSVRSVAAGEGRELRFTAPRLPLAELALTLPPGTQAAQAVGGLGRQEFQVAGGPRLDADLGRDALVLLRWGGPPAPVRKPALTVRENYFWDLRNASSTLTAVLRYTVAAGTASALTVGLPDGLELRGVDVAQVGAAPAGTPAARLKGVQLSGKGYERRLRVELQAPAAGEMQLTLNLVPRPATRPDKLRLLLPAPQQPGVKALQGLLAYHVEGLDSSGKAPGLEAVQPIDPDTFVQAWQRLGMRAPVRPTDAYSFNRKQSYAALELTWLPPPLDAVQEATWRLHPQHADFDAVLKATLRAGSGRDLMLLEWEIPPTVSVFRVTGLPGTPVRCWSAAGNRLQVWLAQPVKAAAVQVQGWLQYPRPAPGRDGRFYLPCLRPLFAEPASNVVRVLPAPGLVVEPEREGQFLNLKRLPGREGVSGLVYQALQPRYRAEFLFRVSPVAPEVRLLTIAEVRDGALTWTAHLDLQVPHGELRTVTLRLRNGSEEAVRLETPGALSVREQRGPRGERAWVLTLPPGVTRRWSARLIATAPPGAPGMPEVTVDGAAALERWVAVLGPGLRAEGGPGLSPVKDALVELRPWPAEAERVRREGAAWKVTRADGALRLTPRPAGAAAAVQVLHAEQQAAVTDLRRWAHQATYWLHAGSGADLQVTLPRGARLTAAAVDAAAVSPRQAGPDVLSLPLSGGEAVRVLRLRWAFAEGAERLEAPNLEAPRLKETAEGLLLWRVDVPAGYRVGRVDPARGARPAGLAAAELGRAEAQLRISALLVERLRAGPADATRVQLLAAQQAFFRHCRRAANFLASPGASAGPAGPLARSPAEWLRDLQQQNGRLGHGTEVDALRARAAESAPASPGDEGAAFFALPERGLPTYWCATATGEAPRLRLTAFAGDRRDEAVLSTELLGLALVGAWIISCLPGLLTWLRRLLPEQLVLVAWLGWQAFGFSLLGAVLIVVAMCARIVLLGSWLQDLFRRQRAEPSTGSSVRP